MLHTLIPFILLIFFIIDVLIMIGFWWYGPLSWYMADYWMYATIVITIQLPLVYIVLYKAYVGPIQHLNQDIAKFMLWEQDEPTIESNTLSKGMNNIISFFIRSLQILKIFKQELKDGRKLRSEVELASEIQEQALGKEGMIVPWLSIAMWSVPASEVGGDSIDIIQWTNDNYYTYIGDVTGHGVPSGFIMMMVNALISAFSTSSTDGAHILSETNNTLKPRIKSNMMMTCVMLRWDAITKKMYYTGAGHEFVLVYKKEENMVYKIKSGWVALGMVKDSSKILKEQQIAYDVGDVIILYTDGISEARYRSDQSGILFGVDRIIESIMKLDVKNSETIFRQLTIDISAFMGYRHKQYDDLSLVVVSRVTDEGDSSLLTSISEKIDSTYITEWNWWQKKSKT